MYADVMRVGRTSIALNLEARRSDVEVGQEEVVASTIITFVQLGEDGNPAPLADHVVETYGHLRR